jgi:hypothetical protein
MMSLISNAPGNGGDRIDIWQLDVRRDWFDLTPIEGEIAAGETAEFTVHFDSNGLPPNTIFEGEFVFDHDGVGSQTIIPVSLSIEEGNVFARRRIDLHIGWNMVSTNLQPDPEDVVELTQPLVEDELLILMKDSNGRFYSPEHNFNSIPRWDVAQGYLMKMSNAGDLSLEGITVASDTPIDLIENWQIISYYPRIPIDAMIAFSGVVDQLLIAKDENGNFYNPEFNFSNMGDLVQGMGYQLKMSEDAELIYRLREEEGVALAIERPLPKQPQFLPIHSRTGRNMSMYIQTDLEDMTEVGVYSDGTLVGSGVINNGKCGIAIWGDDLTTDDVDGALDEAGIELKAFSTEGELEVNVEMFTGDLKYRTDNFTTIELTSLSAVPTEFALGTPFPNPFNSTVKLDFSIVQSGRVNLSIYDVTGRMVAELVNDVRTAGSHMLVWNAEAQPSGIYLARLSSLGETAVVKMTLIR